jgi:hypothetical protein
MKGESNLILTILAILSIFSFTRTLVYVAFNDKLLNLDESANFNFDPIFDKTLLIFAIVRITLSLIVLYNRRFYNDLLSFVLIFFVFSSLQRFYYQYLITHDPKSKVKQYLDIYQNYNSILVFLGSLYIMKYVLF